MKKIKKEIRKRRVSNLAFVGVLLLGCGFIFFFFHQPILVGAGKFLAPEGKGRADVVILEGSELIRENAVRIGLGIISSGEAKRLVVVYHNSEEEKIFGRPSDFDHFLIQKLEDHGLKKEQIKVIAVPKDHPITLTEAQIVLSSLSTDGTRSAILLAEDFHTRRSYWAYKKVGFPLGIEIIPYPYFSGFRNENWWHQVQGVRDFIMESVKFFYYILCGYIPVKSLVMT